MTVLNSIVRRETAKVYRGRALCVALRPTFLEIREKGRRDTVIVDYAAIYEHGLKKRYQLQQAEKAAAKEDCEVAEEEMIYAFDHAHKAGDVCSRAACEHARRAPVLAGSEVYDDVPMAIIREATPVEYLHQAIPAGWCLAPLEYGCDYLYEVELLDRVLAGVP
jgi:hypothetical protein